jgi:hypothetical protein
VFTSAGSNLKQARKECGAGDANVTHHQLPRPNHPLDGGRGGESRVEAELQLKDCMHRAIVYSAVGSMTYREGRG